jgi:hypothetical protein
MSPTGYLCCVALFKEGIVALVGIGLDISIEPVVDFNGDGKVDRLDVGLLMVNWGTDDSPYDIGPTPFGDGIVDSKDLMVLAKHGAILAGDVNYDGMVDFLDLAEVAKNWLRQQP